MALTSVSPQAAIPNTYHFIWLGTEVPYFLVVAVRSVLLHCKDAHVKLWTDEMGFSAPVLTDINDDERFEKVLVSPKDLIDKLEEEDIKQFLKSIFDIAGTKTKHADRRPVERTRSNMIRYLILYLEGGVYLDADTIVRKDLAPLRQADTGFIGKENSIWAITRRSNPLHFFIWAPFLEIFRIMATNLPFGYKWNSLYKKLCSSSENNAVMGMTPKHPFLKACFEYILSMSEEEIVKPLRLGPFLLQRVVKVYKGKDVANYAEPYFYPYGPVISQHFFRKRENAVEVANSMLDDDNYVIHWGASTKTLRNYSKERILQLGSENVFSLLSNETIEGYEN